MLGPELLINQVVNIHEIQVRLVYGSSIINKEHCVFFFMFDISVRMDKIDV